MPGVQGGSTVWEYSVGVQCMSTVYEYSVYEHYQCRPLVTPSGVSAGVDCSLEYSFCRCASHRKLVVEASKSVVAAEKLFKSVV
jgi:hypothetical protein